MYYYIYHCNIRKKLKRVYNVKLFTNVRGGKTRKQKKNPKAPLLLT